MRAERFARAALKGVIGLYRYTISPMTGPTCRFHPTCSAYALEALDSHGAGKGAILALRRILRCHPWNKGPMLDPVPGGIDWPTLIGYKRPHPGARAGHCGCGRACKERQDI